MTLPGMVEVATRLAAPPEIVVPYLTDPTRYAAWMGRNTQLEPVDRKDRT